MTGSNILSLGSMTGFPSLNGRTKADAQADRALAESGRHATDNAAGRLNVGAMRPSRADVRAVIRGAAKAKVPTILLPAVADTSGVQCLAC